MATTSVSRSRVATCIAVANPQTRPDDVFGDFGGMIASLVPDDLRNLAVE
jgi:hypothetical protein